MYLFATFWLEHLAVFKRLSAIMFYACMHRVELCVRKVSSRASHSCYRRSLANS